MKVVSTLDNVSVLEQTLRNENVRKFFNLLIEELKIGKDSRIALSIILQKQKVKKEQLQHLKLIIMAL